MPPSPTSSDIARRAAKVFFATDENPASQKQSIRSLLIGAVESGVLIPLLFYLRFGEVPGLGWGVTIFFIVYCLLAAAGIYFLSHPQYHTTVPLRGNWADKIGAFWLVSCAFGPLIGWTISEIVPITLNNWRWIYMLHLTFAAGLPLLTALPLTRYLRGVYSWVATLILVIVTLLPIWSVVNVSRDLWQGPISGRQEQQPVYYLEHTDRILHPSPRQ